MCKLQTIARLTALCLGTSALALGANAATTSWNGGTSSWFTAGNWSNGVPGAADIATVSNSGKAQIAGAATAQTLNIGSGSIVEVQTGGSLTAGSGIMVGSGPSAGTLLLSGPSNVTGAITLTNGFLTSNVTGTLSNKIAIDQSYGAFITSLAGTTLTLAGPISGGSWVAAGGGTTILTGANTYLLTSISGGATLQIGDGGTTGTLGTGSVIGSGALVFKRSDILTVTNVFSGSNTMAIVSGTLIMNGTDQRSGSTTILPGATLQIGNGGTAGLITGDIIDNGNLTFDRSDSVTFAGVISGTGSVTQAGTGTLTLSGINTYTGLTTVSTGNLQVIQTAGGFSVNGNIVDNATVLFDTRGHTIYGGTISGIGRVLINDFGTTIFTGANTYTGGTIVSDATLQIGNGGTSGSVTGNISVGNDSTLIFNRSDSMTLGGTIASGSGLIRQTGTGTTILAGANNGGSYQVSAGTLQLGSTGSLASGATLEVNGGTFDLNGHAQTISDLFGTGGSIALGAGTLTDTSRNSRIYAGTISGTGGLNLQLFNVLILTGTNSYTGGTAISAGTLQLGVDGSLASTGALAVNTSFSTSGTFDLNSHAQTVGALSGTGGFINLGSGALTTNSASDTVLASVISGIGSLTKGGSGMLTLTGVSTYNGSTIISGGRLNVTGSIAASAVTVQSGAALSGTGTVGATTVQSGGTLAPGSGGIGILNVNGNLALASGSAFNADISPSASDTVAVSGAASINGVLTAPAASGTYVAGQRYTLISATGGLSGTFSSFTTPGLPGYVRPRLGYDGNDAYLFLDPNTLTPLLPSGASANQKNVAAGIDAAVQGGAVLGNGFNALYGQTGAALTGSLDQLSGQIGANTASAVGQSFAPFLTLLTQGAPQADAPQATARFAPDGAYGAANAPNPAQRAPGEILIWGAAYGGHAGISGDATSGAASLSASDYGFAVGAETGLGMVTAGAGIAVGQQRFDSGNGTGQSTDVTLGLYGRGRIAEDGYFSASFGYGWHDIATTRTVTAAGTDILQAKMDAHQWGGRIEGGWRVSDLLTPFAAFEGTQFELPAYSEHAVSGASTFALAYAAQDTGEAHSEVGARLGRAFALEDGELSAQGRLAWAHELEDTPFAVANFQGLTGSAFAVAGTRVADDTALLGLDLDVHQASGLSFGVAMQSQFGSGTTVWQGMGHIGLRW